MKFSYDIEVADLGEEVNRKFKSGEYSANSVFAPKPVAAVGQVGETPRVDQSREPNKIHTGNREAEARRAWRPKGFGDFVVEVRKNRNPDRQPTKFARD